MGYTMRSTRLRILIVFVIFSLLQNCFINDKADKKKKTDKQNKNLAFGLVLQSRTNSSSQCYLVRPTSIDQTVPFVAGTRTDSKGNKSTIYSTNISVIVTVGQKIIFTSTTTDLSKIISNQAIIGECFTEGYQVSDTAFTRNPPINTSNANPPSAILIELTATTNGAFTLIPSNSTNPTDIKVRMQ